MTKHLRLAVSALVAIQLAACISPPKSPLPDVDQQSLAVERQHMAQAALNSWNTESARLYTIREKLWLTATQRGECPKTGPDRGALLQTVADLPSGLHDEVISAGLRSGGLYVAAVAPGSPAALSDVQAGDRIVAVSRDHIAVHDALPGGWQDAAEISLDLSNANGDRTVSIGSRSLCNVDVVLDNSHDIWANYDGSRIYVSQGMLQALPDDASLAFVLAHELIHFTAKHTGLASIFNAAGSRDQEREADLMGIRLVAHAGYDLTQVATIWDRLALLDPNRIGFDFLADHPLRAERKLRLQAAIAAIQAEKNQS